MRQSFTAKICYNFWLRVIKWLKSTEYVEIFFDESNRLIFFKPSQKTAKNAMHLQKFHDRPTNNHITADAIMKDRNIAPKQYQANWSQDMSMVVVKYDLMPIGNESKP